MTKTFNLLNGHSFVFIVVVVVSLIVISLYMIIAPEPNVPYNFDPFPKTAPVDLPDPAHHTDTCWNKLTPCDDEGMCSACSRSEYKCLSVSKKDGEKKRYHFNGINVPEGKWCVPKDDNPNPVCNEHTGRWTWVFDQEYCAEINNGKSQCWKCECLYPSMYSDPSTGCITKQVCQNRSIRTVDKNQPHNLLQGTEYGEAKYKGKTWDPISGTDSGILSISPYAKDEAGNALFACQCDSDAGDQFFTKLPNDPYTCHLAPCFGYFGNQETGLNSDGVCECGTNTALSPGGQWKNTCVGISGSCGKFGYNHDAKICTCGGSGPWWPTECKSKYTGVKMDRDDLKECSEPQNALGSECRNPCEEKENKCFHGAPCDSEGPWKSFCDCSATTEAPPAPFQWAGVQCDQECVKNGTRIAQRSGFEKTWCYKDGCCCSDSTERKHNFINSWYTVDCTSSDPPAPGKHSVGACGKMCCVTDPVMRHDKDSCLH